MNGVLIIIVLAGICSAPVVTSRLPPAPVVKYQVPAPIPTMAQLDVMKLAGKWYHIAVVRHDRLQRNVLGYVMEPRKKGEQLVLITDIPRKKDCRQVRVLLHRIYVAEFDTDDERTTVHIVDTDYDTYHIIHFTFELMASLHLYGREQTVSEEVKEKFRNYARDMQFNPEAIIYVPENGICL